MHKYCQNYIKYNEIKRELRNNYGDEKEKQRKLDLLKYQFDEIKNANLKVGEEEKLEEKRKIMLNSEKIAKKSPKFKRISGIILLKSVSVMMLVIAAVLFEKLLVIFNAVLFIVVLDSGLYSLLRKNRAMNFNCRKSVKSLNNSLVCKLESFRNGLALNHIGSH